MRQRRWAKFSQREIEYIQELLTPELSKDRGARALFNEIEKELEYREGHK